MIEIQHKETKTQRHKGKKEEKKILQRRRENAIGSFFLFFLPFVSLCLCVFVLNFLPFLHLDAQEEAYVIFYVDAPHLCYHDFKALCDSLKRSRGYRDFNVGHAWIELHGELEGRKINLQVGHSGELGIKNRPYFQGVMDLVEANDPNPISYLFSTLQDGFAQAGSGAHKPTYAAKKTLTEGQLRAILSFIHPKRYSYTEYALTGNQCAAFVAKVASLAGCPIKHKVAVSIPSHLTYGGIRMRLWSNPIYRTIVFSSPDQIETSLKSLVESKQAELVSLH